MRAPITIAAALVAAASIAAPAAAQSVGLTVTQTAHGVQVPTGSGQAAVAVLCSAVSTGTSATDVRECYLRGADGSRHDALNTSAKPLAWDASVGAHVVVPDQAYQVCVRTRVLSTDASTFYETPVVCSAVNRVSA